MADIPDPVAETVPEALPARPEQPRQRSVVLPVVGGVVAAVIGFGLAQVVPNGWPVGDVAALEASLTSQSAEIAALKAEIGRLAETSAPKPDLALEERLSSVEEAVKTITPVDLGPLTDRTTALEKQIADISTLSAGAATDPAALNQLRAEVEALKTGALPQNLLSEATTAMDAKLAEVDAQLASVKSQAEAMAKAATQKAALHQIMASLESGSPYASALGDLAEMDVPPVIADNAKTGLPSLQSLRGEFPEVARAALDAALRANPGGTWTERVGTFLRGQTGARSLTPREGSDPDAILSRAEAALAQDDLADVIQEIATLPAEGQAAMADWTARVALRIEAAKSIHGLIAVAEQ